jgi:hypothetical protein
MKLFISWSGELSKEIAEIFREWIPGVIQAAKPYYSPDDITKGTRWSSEISKELDLSKIGIICLTKENLESPWIMFEAGALSKNLEKSKVCPLLFGIEPSDIKGPLVQFQAAKFSKKEMKKVIKMMNDELESTSLASDVLDNVFEMWWPKLQEQIEKVVEKARNGDNSDLRTERDLLEEVLTLTRGLSIDRRRRGSKGSIHPGAIEDLIQNMERLISLNVFEDNPEAVGIFEKFYKPIEHIITESRDEIGITKSDELSEDLQRLRFRLEDYSIKVTEKISPRLRRKK